MNPNESPNSDGSPRPLTNGTPCTERGYGERRQRRGIPVALGPGIGAVLATVLAIPLFECFYLAVPLLVPLVGAVIGGFVQRVLVARSANRTAPPASDQSRSVVGTVEALPNGAPSFDKGFKGQPDHAVASHSGVGVALLTLILAPLVAGVAIYLVGEPFGTAYFTRAVVLGAIVGGVVAAGILVSARRPDTPAK